MLMLLLLLLLLMMMRLPRVRVCVCVRVRACACVYVFPAIGSSSYPDFGRAAVRNWWASHFSPAVYKGATAALYTWIDMNEVCGRASVDVQHVCGCICGCGCVYVYVYIHG